MGVHPPIETYDELDSTNAEARRRAEAGEGGPVWITAARQTAGRGRRGRAWSTNTGNLAATQVSQLGIGAGFSIAGFLIEPTDSGNGNGNGNGTIPEPGTLALLGVALVGLALSCWRAATRWSRCCVALTSTSASPAFRRCRRRRA